MSDIPEKWRIRCPLDHSSFEKFVNCDCNYGNARDVWWFKEQQIKKLQEQNKNLETESKKKDLIIENLTAFLRKYQNSEDAYTYREIQDEIYLDVSDYLNFISKKQAREALAKVEE